MEFIRFVQSFHSPFLDTLAQLITSLGEDYFFIVIAAITIWCINKKIGWRLGMIALSSAALNAGLKQIFRIERPIGGYGIRSLRLETAGGYSFPSGHSQFTASIWTAIAKYLDKSWFYFLAGIVMSLVGLSRIYLGVHFISDVIAGLAIGIIWAFLADYLLGLLEKKPTYLYLLGALIIALMPFLPLPDFYKVGGTVLGLIIGYLLEKRYVNYCEKAPLWVQLLKIILGLAGVLAIKEGLKLLLPSLLLSDALRYLVIGVWVTALAPYLFTFLPHKITEKKESV